LSFVVEQPSNKLTQPPQARKRGRRRKRPARTGRALINEAEIEGRGCEGHPPAAAICSAFFTSTSAWRIEA
jgi:hypothetical protein